MAHCPQKTVSHETNWHAGLMAGARNKRHVTFMCVLGCDVDELCHFIEIRLFVHTWNFLAAVMEYPTLEAQPSRSKDASMPVMRRAAGPVDPNEAREGWCAAAVSPSGTSTACCRRASTAPRRARARWERGRSGLRRLRERTLASLLLPLLRLDRLCRDLCRSLGPLRCLAGGRSGVSALLGAPRGVDGGGGRLGGSRTPARWLPLVPKSRLPPPQKKTKSCHPRTPLPPAWKVVRLCCWWWCW